MILLNKLDEIMKQKGISDKELCEQTRLTRMTLYNLKQGRGSSLSSAYKISQALGVPIESIWFEESEEQVA